MEAGSARNRTASRTGGQWPQPDRFAEAGIPVFVLASSDRRSAEGLPARVCDRQGLSPCTPDRFAE